MKTVAQIIKENPGLRYFTAACGYLDRVDKAIRDEVKQQYVKVAYPCWEDTLYIETTGHDYIYNEMRYPNVDEDIQKMYKNGAKYRIIAQLLDIDIDRVKRAVQKGFKKGILKRRK